MNKFMFSKKVQVDVDMKSTPALSGSERTSFCPDDVSIVDRTNALIRGLDLILVHWCVHESIRVALDKQVHDYLDVTNDETVWGKHAKSLLTYPFAKFLRNVPPDAPPFGYFKPKGALRRWMKSRLLSYDRKNVRLWNSWLQVKKNTLDSSESIVDAAYLEHCKVLVNKDDGDDELIDQIFSIPAFKEHLDDIASKSFESILKSKRGFTDFFPSSSASFSSPRGNGGAYSELLKLLGRSPTHSPYTTDLVAMTYVPNLNGRATHSIHEIRCVSLDLGEDWKDLIPMLAKREQRTLQAAILGIVEPMKVRVISKGPALEYYGAKPFQNALHSVMRNMNAYRLIGRPMCPTDSLDCKVKSDPNWEWFSVDYKAATDNLSWKYSSRILSTLIANWSPHMRDLAMDVLGPHELVYPSRTKIPSKKMERGQLMGSILSFPILCIANMGLYLSVTDDLHKGWSTQERLDHVLINGDDQLYAAPSSLWESHIDKGRRLGLEMSIGKAYHHPRYLNVNSTSIDLPMSSKHPYEINYLNSGLFYGVSKVRSQTDTDQIEKNGISLLPKVLNGALPGKQKDLLKYWFSQTDPALIRKWTTVQLPHRRYFCRNIFLPISLGGMGVDCPLGFKFFTTRQQKTFATLCKRKMGPTVSQLPLPRFSPKALCPFKEMPYYKSPAFKVEDFLYSLGSSTDRGFVPRDTSPLIPYSYTRRCYVL